MTYISFIMTHQKVHYNYYSASVFAAVCTFFSAVLFIALSAKKLKNINGKFLKVAISMGTVSVLANMLATQKRGRNAHKSNEGFFNLAISTITSGVVSVLALMIIFSILIMELKIT